MKRIFIGYKARSCLCLIPGGDPLDPPFFFSLFHGGTPQTPSSPSASCNPFAEILEGARTDRRSCDGVILSQSFSWCLRPEARDANLTPLEFSNRIGSRADGQGGRSVKKASLLRRVQSSPLVHLAPDRLALSHDPQTVYLASALAIFNLHALQHHNLVCLGGSYPLLLNIRFN
jgi:hypothetical protein